MNSLDIFLFTVETGRRLRCVSTHLVSTCNSPEVHLAITASLL